MKKYVSSFLVLMIVLFLFTACSTNQKSGGEAKGKDGKTEITVWTWPNNDQTFEEITIPLFEKKYPDIKVTVQAFSQDKYHDKLATAAVSGKGPDVAMVEINNVIKFKELGAFEDLSKDPYNADEFDGKYVDFFWNYVKGKDGYIFALPKNSAPAAMFYNKTLFKEAGLPSEPAEVHELLKTWDDYVEVAKQLSKSGKQWMIDTPGGIVDTIMQQGGTSYFDKNGKLLIGNEHFKFGYDLVDKLNDIEAVSPYEAWSPEWNASMQNGTVATFFSGNWFGKYLKNNAVGTEGEWGVTYAPEYNGQSSFNNGGDFIGILKDSKNKEAAWKFTQFVSQDMENLKGMYEKDELYPAFLAGMEADWMNQENEFFGGQVTNEIFKNVQEKMGIPYPTKNDQIAKDAVGKMLTNITFGGKTINDSLEQAIKEVESRVKK
ncbi:ABC transporter substrate-binding protein [Neobacillus jeddahensis]|uniref:ABC transporter substrate-binding protein n=1 Tax=Neobacillus jeddahensis TaxID=1461580 RepID=UPI00058FD52A|nr:sugar ABC transporter substrate-binding protein [Neobacillus jeddahensis]